MSAVRVEPLEGALGACLSGVDARRSIGGDDLALIRDALTEHQVLFLRGQDLSVQEHLAFAAQFGPLFVEPVSRLKGSPKILSYIEDAEDRPPAEFPWHTDLSWLSEPPAFAVLNARVIPDQGGDTIWVNLFAAYEALSPERKQQVQRLKLRHRPKPHFFEAVRRHHGDEITNRLIAENPPVEHPLIRSHPLSDRPVLFLSPLYEDSLVGLAPEESDALLASLHQQLDNPEFQVRWRWQEQDLVIWDEASTNHCALGDHYPSRRVMQRCAVEGSRPFFRAVS
jgi:taurine dioxygenase